MLTYYPIYAVHAFYLMKWRMKTRLVKKLVKRMLCKKQFSEVLGNQRKSILCWRRDEFRFEDLPELFAGLAEDETNEARLTL